MVEKIQVKPSFTYDNGVWNIDIDKLILPAGFSVVERKILNIPPHIASGNHRHPRQEIFISSSPDVIFYWQDSEGALHEEKMADSDGLYMFLVRPNTPHALKNTSDSNVLLLELANGALENVEEIFLT